MNATIITRTSTSFTLQIEVPYNDSMLDFEETLQERLNDAGVVATAEGLKQFDTDGSPITVGPIKFTSKGQVEKDYQTPYGVATVARHVYQSPEGGPTYCPLDRDARIVVTSTPRFAKVLSHKYAEFSSPRVQIDLKENHGRAVSRCLIQDVADAVARRCWPRRRSGATPCRSSRSHPPRWPSAWTGPACISARTAGGRRWSARWPSTTGRGERLHTVYLGATPEYGKAKFLDHLEAEIERCQGEVPGGSLRGDRRRGEGELGLPGSAHRRAGDRLLACGGVPGQGGGGVVPGPASDRKAWLDDACHRLKHESGGAEWVLKRLRTLARERPWAKGDEDVERAITYFANQSGAGRMDYAARVAAAEPIGSGVTEAACKVIVKQRLCGSGMKWTEDGAAVVLSLRALSYTPERWGQFWSKVDRWGFPAAA